MMTMTSKNDEILKLLKSMEKAQIEIIKVLDRIEKKHLNNDVEANKPKPIVSRPPFYYQRKKDKL